MLRLEMLIKYGFAVLIRHLYFKTYALKSNQLLNEINSSGQQIAICFIYSHTIQEKCSKIQDKNFLLNDTNLIFVLF